MIGTMLPNYDGPVVHIFFTQTLRALYILELTPVTYLYTHYIIHTSNKQTTK